MMVIILKLQKRENEIEITINNHSCTLLAETCRNLSRVGNLQTTFFFKTGGSDNVFNEEEYVIRI